MQRGCQDGLAVHSKNDTALFADVRLPTAVRAFPRSLQHRPEDGIIHIGMVAVQ